MSEPSLDLGVVWLDIGGFGIPVIETPYAVTSEEVDRTWRERLFSWPWRPWVRTKFVNKPAIYVFSPSLYGEVSRRGGGLAGLRDAIIVHPALVAQIKNLEMVK